MTGNPSFMLGDWQVEPELNQICRGTELHHLEAKTMDVLTFLVARADRVVPTDELLDDVWEGRHVEPSTVHRRINQLRNVLGDDPKAPRYIQTIVKRGYKVVAPIEMLASDPLIPEPVDVTSASIDDDSRRDSTLPFTDRSDTRDRRNRAPAIAALGLVGLIAGVALVSWLQPSERQPDMGPIVRVPIELEEWVGWKTVNPGNPTPSIAMSPTGDTVAYIGRDENGVRSLWVRHLDQLSGMKLDGTARAEKPFFSPDGRWIGYFDAGVMKRISVNGGDPSRITALERSSWGASWGSDDQIIFADGPSGLTSVSVSSGETRTVTVLEDQYYSHRLPQHVSGHPLLLITKVRGSSFTHETWALHLETGEERYLFNGLARAYVEPGYIVYSLSETSVQGSLWAVPFDPVSMAVTGPTRSIQAAIAGGRGSAVAVARAGPLLYQPTQGDLFGELVLMDPDGGSRLLEQGSEIARPKFSNDGESVAVVRYEGGLVSPQIWIHNLGSGGARLFKSGGRNPLWSVDDRSITYMEDGRGLVRQWLDGENAPETLVPHPRVIIPIAWLDAGRTLLYSADAPLYVRDSNGESRQIHAQGAAASLTTDQRWIAFCTWPRGVFIAPFPRFGSTTTVSDSGCSPHWSPDETRIYYQDQDKLWSVETTVADDVTLGSREVVADLGYPNFFLPLYDVDSKGRVVFARHHESDPKPPVLLVNWRRLLDTAD